MEVRNPSIERPFQPLSGGALLVLDVLLGAAVVALLVTGARADAPLLAVLALPFAVAFFLVMSGFFVVEPNLGRALVLFGTYRGTVRTPGFYWTNPFTSKKKISLRAHNLDGKTLKVNDLLGNPIEIAAIVVWQVRDSARALFDVENHEQFVATQAESAVRMVASRHPYDDGQTNDVQTTLRGSADDVARELAEELSTRLELAGIEVLEARLSHLAYSAEIAAASAGWRHHCCPPNDRGRRSRHGRASTAPFGRKGHGPAGSRAPRCDGGQPVGCVVQPGQCYPRGEYRHAVQLACTPKTLVRYTAWQPSTTTTGTMNSAASAKLCCCACRPSCMPS